MLHLPKDGAQSMYLDKNEPAKWTVHQDWYRQARSKAVSSGQEQLAGLLSVPGAVLFRAPLYWDLANELAEKVNQQRALLHREQLKARLQYPAPYAPGVAPARQ